MPAKQLPVSQTGKPNPVDIQVGGRVRLRRTLLGLSQEKLGEAVGLSFQQIQKYERGANRISASRLHAISHVLEVSVPFFFEDMPPEITGKGGKSASGPAEGIQEGFAPDPLAKRETLELVRAYYRIKDPSVRKRLYDLVKSLSGAVPRTRASRQKG
jgi:transcriptional regulator with XRE-family HTH domain